MENFQYSVQLSDQDWAEFSATAEECGLLQAGLASGDEPLSSDIDQGDSSGSSPPGPRSLLGGSGWRGFEEEDQAAAQQLVSRSWQEPILAQGAGQQMPSTSAWSEARPSLSPGAISPGQSAPLQGPGPPRDEMQRLLQGPAPRDPAPRPPGESPPSPGSPGRSTLPQRPPGSPGAQQRSPSRKKRRAAGAKGGGRSSAAGSAPSPLGSPVLAEARPKGGLGPAGSRGKDLSAGAGEQTAGARQDERGPESAGVPEQVAQPRPGPDLSTPVPTTEQGTDLLRMTPGAELHTVSTPAQGPCPDFSTAKSDMAPSALASELRPDTAPSTPASELRPDTALSTPACKPCPDTALSAPASELRPDTAPSTPACKPRPDTAVSTPACKLRPDTVLPTPACKPRLDEDLPLLGPEVKPEVDFSTPVSKAQSDVGVSTPAPTPLARPDTKEAKVAPLAKLDTSSVVSSGGHQEKPGGEPSAGAPGRPSAEPLPASRKKKVRFSMAVPSPEEPGSEEALRPPSPAAAWPSAPRTAAGGRGGPGAWDAVAVGPRLPQPRILKHLPPPAPSTSGAPGYRSCFAVTVPEAYEFFFCDTIEEEDEDAEEEAEAGEAAAQVQWPEVCEFFFRDSRAKRSGHRGGPPLASPPEGNPVPTPVPGDPVPISIPEAYEHFLGEDKEGTLGPAALLQLQATEAPAAAPQGGEPGPPAEPSPAAAEQLDLVLRQAGEPRGALTSFTFSQNDMCLVFVAFATWAVRTSDLHAPDAWKTVLLANIGTISAIRYFRRQVGRERRSPSPSPSPSPSS